MVECWRVGETSLEYSIDDDEMFERSPFEFHLWGRDCHSVGIAPGSRSHWGVRKTTTFTSTKWVFVFIIKLLEGKIPALLEGRIPPLQNEFWFLHVFIVKLLEGNTPALQNEYWLFTCFYMFFLWCYWRETRHPYKMSCGNDWSFSMSPPPAAHHAPHLFALTHQPRSLRP